MRLMSLKQKLPRAPLPPFTICGCSEMTGMKQVEASTRHHVCRYLDLGFLTPRTVRNSVVYKPHSLGSLLKHPEKTKIGPKQVRGPEGLSFINFTVDVSRVLCAVGQEFDC